MCEVDKSKLFSFLKGNKLFSGCTDEEISVLIPSIKTQHFNSRDIVFKEGESGEYFYLIVSGSASIIKMDGEVDEEYPVAKLQAGEWFGEMLVFETGLRSASARAEEALEVLLIPLKAFSSFSKGVLNLAKETTSRLKSSNESALHAFKEELRMTKAHDLMGQFIIHLFILFTIYLYTVKFFEQYTGDSLISQMGASILICVFAISAVVMVAKSEYSFEFFGLTLKNWKKNAYESFIFTLPILALLVIFKMAMVFFVAEFKEIPVFEFGPKTETWFHFFHSANMKGEFFFLLGVYILLVPIQEFLARGCLQGVLEQFFTSPNKVFLSILASNLLFGMFHGLKTMSFAASAFLMGLFWGWLYTRQKSLVGPIISHAMVGAWAFGCLDLQSLLVY